MLLYSQTKKKTRRAIEPINKGLKQNEYYDIARLREIVLESIGVLDKDCIEPIRVRLIRREPYVAYRVTILKKWTSSHTVKRKDETTCMLPPGNYVWKTWWVDRTQDGFIFSPVLPDRENTQ